MKLTVRDDDKGEKEDDGKFIKELIIFYYEGIKLLYLFTYNPH